MKTISLLLVTLGVCLAKPPAARFPDFLAPFRGIFGPRGGHHPPGGERSHSHPHDSAGAETGKQSAPFPGEENNSDNNFRPYFPSFSNSPYEEGGNFPPSERQGRPPFQHDGRPPPPQHFHGEGRPGPPPSHFPPERSTNFRRPTRQHRPPFYQPQPQHHPPSHHHHRPPTSGFSNFSPQNQQQEQQSTGFTDFAFNPADFDRGNYGSEERRPGPLPDIYQPSKPSSNFHADSPPTQGGGPGADIMTLADLQKGGSSPNGAGGVYFDEVYRQPPGGQQGNSIFQEEPIRGGRGPAAGHRRPPPPQFPHSSSSEESSNYGETRGKKVYFRPGPPPQSQSQEEVHYGKPMVMSGSAPPTILRKPRKHHRNPPVLLSAPAFQGPKVHSEPITAASGHGGEGYGAEGGHGGDRILYHVAGHAGPYSYRFGYDTGNGYNRMFRHEEKDGNGFVKGKYGFHDKNGKLQVINYHAHPTEGFHSERAH